MPSTKLLNVKIKALPCFEQEGMIWIWPGDDPPTANLPSLLPPSGFQIHAEVWIKVLETIYINHLVKTFMIWILINKKTDRYGTSCGTWALT